MIVPPEGLSCPRVESRARASASALEECVENGQVRAKVIAVGRKVPAPKRVEPREVGCGQFGGDDQSAGHRDGQASRSTTVRFEKSVCDIGERTASSSMRTSFHGS